MKLFFDARYTRTDYHDGISRYSAELGNALAKITEVTFLISSDQQKKWFPSTAQFLKIHAPTSVKEPFTAFVLNKHHPDVVYSPMQTIGTLGRRYRSALTIHDLIYYRHPAAPKFLPAPVRVGWRMYHAAYWPQRLLLKGGDLITSVSQTTAHEMAKAHMTTKPVVVVPNAPQRFATHPVKHEKVIKNIVYMGSFMPYKNVETLITAMQWLPGRTLHLLSRIQPQRRRELEALVPADAQVIFHNGVSDGTYEQLLANNALLATASLDEGFGIPVAEAMAMGVPAVVSDIPIFHEVGGGGVVYFPATSPQDFAKHVQELDDTEHCKKLIAAARAQSQQFDWDTSAKTLLEAIERIPQ